MLKPPKARMAALIEGQRRGTRLPRSSGLLLAAVLCLTLIVFGALLPQAARQAFIAEGGFVESLTVVGYTALIIALIAVSRNDRVFFAASAVVIALLAARELDLHKAVISESVLKSRTYLSDAVPLAEKLIAGAVVIAFALFLVWYAVKYARRLWLGLTLSRPAAWSVLIGLVLLPIAKALDSFARIVHDVTGVAIHTGTALQLPEEVFELAAPLVLLWAVLQYAAQQSRRPPEPNQG